MTMRQIVSISLPMLALERWRRTCPDDPAADPAADQPFALVAEGTHGPVVVGPNHAAMLAGVAPGARLADARALCPPLRVASHDAAGDAAHRVRLAHWARRWGPLTALADDGGILVETSGVAHLFGGEARLLEDVVARFAAIGHRVGAAMAPAPGAAIALSRHAPGSLCLSAERLPALLAPLPVAALRIDEATALLLRRLGLKTIGDLAAVPRESLARRFRTKRIEGNPLLRLDQALGVLAEPLVPETPDPPQRAMLRVAEPVIHVDILLPLLRRLAADLAKSLERQGHGARRLAFEAYRMDGEVARAEAECARATRDPDHIAQLFGEKVERFDAGFGFDAFALSALRHEPLAAAQPGLDGSLSDEARMGQLVDRLVARLGPDAVASPLLHESHLPERAVGWIPVGAAPERQRALQFALPFHDRPLRLFDPAEPIAVVYATPEGFPRRFRWRRRAHDVTRVEGPERIAPEWWRERGGTRARDYYKVEDERGARFWIYRAGQVGDGRGGAPDWYLQGLFA